MPIINVFDKVGEKLETHIAETGITLTRWLIANIPSYSPEKTLFTARLNGVQLPSNEYDSKLLSADEVDLVIEPQGDPVTTTILAIIAVVSAAYSYYVASNLPRGYESSTEPGESIYSPKARANSIKPNAYIREVAGEINIFPDLICPPHRRYEDPTGDDDEYLLLMMSVGAGHFFIQQENVYIGETPIRNYAGDFTLQVFDPGTILTGVEPNENWYQTKEIDNLKLTTESSIATGDWTADFSGATITSYFDGVVTAFPFQVGEIFELSQVNDGIYQVVSIAGGSNQTATVDLLERTSTSLARLEAVASQSAYFNVSDGGYIKQNVNRLFFENQGPATFPVTSGNSVSWQSQTGGVNWNGPFKLTPPGVTTDALEIDVLFDGLSDLDGNNNNVNASVTIEVQYRDVFAEEWSTPATFTYNGATYDQLGFTETINLPGAIEPLFRIRRVTPDSDRVELTDQCVIQRVKSRIQTGTFYSDVTTIALKIRGSNSLARTAQNQINIRGAQRKLPTMAELESGTWNLDSSSTQTESLNDVEDAELLFSIQLTDYSNEPLPQSGQLSHSFDISPDGRWSIIYNDENVRLYQLSDPLSPYDFSGQKILTSTYTASATGNPGYCHFGENETIMMLLEWTGAAFQMRRILSVSPFTVFDTHTFGAELVANPGVDFSQDGNRLWISNGSAFGSPDHGMIYLYELVNAFEFFGLVGFQQSVDISGDLGTDAIVDIEFSEYPSGMGNFPNKLFVYTDAGDILEYDTPGGGLVGLTYIDTYNVSTFSNSRSFKIHDDRQMWITSAPTSDLFVNQYNIESIADNRASRSIMRFIGFMIRNSMPGSEPLVDWDAMNDLDVLLESRGDTLDGEFVDETLLWDAIKMALQPAYAIPVVKDGLFTPVRIAQRTDFDHFYTPDVIIGDLKIDQNMVDQPEVNNIDAEYFDSSTNANELIVARYDGADPSPGTANVIKKDLRPFGTTDQTRAWRVGMRERALYRYKPATYTFTTELDALASDVGDRIMIASNLLSNQNGSVTGYAAPTVELDFEPTFPVGGQMYAVFRTREGEVSQAVGQTSTGYYLVEPGSNPNEIELITPAALDFSPVLDFEMDDTLVSLFDAADMAFAATVQRIVYNGDNTVTLTASEYLDELYSNDDLSPP